MGWSDRDFCIKCEKGGKVLACSDNSCPLAVHEKCMGFPVKFDEIGNFYCPYCSYRRAIEESRQARDKALLSKKALSTFIDMGMINGDKPAREIWQSKGKESIELQNVLKGNNVHGCDDDNRLDWAIVLKNDTLPQEEQQEQQDDFASQGTITVSLPKENGVALFSKQDNALYSKYHGSVAQCDLNDRLLVVGQKTSTGPIVACGNDDVSCDGEETTRQFEVVEIGRGIQLEHGKHMDDYQLVKTVKNHLEDHQLGDSSIAENQGNDFSRPTKRVRNDANLFDENEGTVAGEEGMEEDAQEDISSSAVDPAFAVDLNEKGVKTDHSMCRDSKAVSSSKGVEQNDERRGHAIDVHSLRRSSPKSSSAPKDNAEQIEINTSIKLKQLTGHSPGSSRNLFPSARRKKLLWTDDEEEMLKEGVQKFSTTVNYNIPWRKILEFGRHVFHRTRTPVDLKDKWRNILAKER